MAESKKLSWKGSWEILKQSFRDFSSDKLTKLAGSLAYYTVFSMGPLLIVIIFLSSIFLEKEAVEGTIYSQLETFLGHDTASQLEQIIRNASLKGKRMLPAIIGIVTLVIGATTVFAEIQDSINYIWKIKPKPKKGWLQMLRNRLLSFSVIISLGFILVVSLAVTSVIDIFSRKLQARFPDTAVVVFYIINQLLTLIILTLIFGVIFKVLPDARIKWRDVLAGACITAVLFMLGKFGISFYISTTSVGTTYGAAGALVILIVWTYYSSLILYFGAEITKNYALRYGEEIRPAPYAVAMKEIEVEEGKKPLQEVQGKEKRKAD